MIGAIPNNISYMQTLARPSAEPPVTRTSTSAAGGIPELAQQVSELIESHGETAEAILQAQVSVFKEALDIRQSMASGVLQMLNGMRTFQAHAQPAGAAQRQIDVVA